MNVNGPTPIAPISRQDDASLALRVNQRLAAEVLQVSGDRVVLALEGVQVVAQLTSPDQAAALAGRRFAQFLVRDLSASAITLQLVPTPGTPAAPAASAAQLVPQILQQAGLPVSPTTETIARALLSQGLALTPELASELHAALAGMEGWGVPEAQVAAALKAQGFPLTPEALALAACRLPPLAELLAGLDKQLQNLLRGRTSPALVELARSVAQILQSLVVDPQAKNGDLAEKLRQAAALLGRSLENELVHGKGGDAGPPTGWMALAALRGELARQGSSPLLEALDSFLNGVRQMQFANTPPDPATAQGRWLRLDLPLGGFGMAPGGINPSRPQTARLRVAYRPEGEGSKLDLANTRLVLQVDLGPEEAVQVDLSVVDRRVGARVTATSEALCEKAERALPSLETGLERLGYSLQSARFDVACLRTQPAWAVPGANPTPWEMLGEGLSLQV
jgi:hypothetical protein